MGKKCQVTGKKPFIGKSISRRGIAKKKKGIGLNTTGVVKRKFYPNLMTKRFWFEEENRFVKLRISTKAMKTIDRLGIGSVIRKMRKNGQKI